MILLAIVCLALSIKYSQCAPPRPEALLLDHLMTNYSKLVPPFTSSQHPLNVTFGIELIHILSVDDRAQILTTKWWVRQSWVNPFLSWDPTQWNGIYVLMVEPEDVWIPDVVLYESVDPEKGGGRSTYRTQILLQANGVHTWFSPVVFSTTCKINIKFFPFDQQECRLKFGSYFYDSTMMNMKMNDREVINQEGNYVTSTEWDIKRADKQVNLVKYDCCHQPYSDLTFTLHLRRKPSFYMFNIILPCIVLAATILLGFFLPPESGERIGLTITILLAMAVLMQVISTILPVNSDETPQLSVFFMIVLIESAASLITTCAVLVVHYRGDQEEVYPMPPWVRTIFVDFLAAKLGLSKRGKRDSKVKDGFDVRENGHVSSNEVGIEVKEVRKRSNGRNGAIGDLKNGEKDDAEAIDMSKTPTAIKKNEDWHTVGKVLDRVSFLLFFLVLVISALAILVPMYLRNEH